MKQQGYVRLPRRDGSICVSAMHGQRDIKVSMLDRLVNQTGLQLFDLLRPDPEDPAREPTPSLQTDTCN